jgi:hypothetical protein
VGVSDGSREVPGRKPVTRDNNDNDYDDDDDDDDDTKNNTSPTLQITVESQIHILPWLNR